MVRRLYLDTSAYLAALYDEPGSPALREEMRDAVLITSALLAVEARRSVIRLSRERHIAAEKYLACWERIDVDLKQMVVRDVTLELCNAGVFPSLSIPRSLDLVHLRTALAFHAQDALTRFVSLDQAQNAAARELGLPV